MAPALYSTFRRKPSGAAGHRDSPGHCWVLLQLFILHSVGSLVAPQDTGTLLATAGSSSSPPWVIISLGSWFPQLS